MQNVVIMCIGTEKIIGDSLGPMVGSMLEGESFNNVYIYGNLINPINKQNLSEYIAFIESAHKSDLIVAVDAGLGAVAEVGKIKVMEGGLCPGGVTGEKIKVGQIGIMGIVNDYNKNYMHQLLNVKLSFVEKMAKQIVGAIKLAI